MGAVCVCVIVSIFEFVILCLCVCASLTFPAFLFQLPSSSRQPQWKIRISESFWMVFTSQKRELLWSRSHREHVRSEWDRRSRIGTATLALCLFCALTFPALGHCHYLFPFLFCPLTICQIMFAKVHKPLTMLDVFDLLHHCLLHKYFIVLHFISVWADCLFTDSQSMITLTQLLCSQL